MSQLLLTSAFVVALWFDLRPKLKERRVKECWITIAMMAVSYTILILVSFGVEVPSAFRPAELLGNWLLEIRK